MNFRSKRRDDVDLNITPLIDVVFLLLIFFMVTTTFERESEINITLPEASEENIKTEPDFIEVSIDRQGTVFVNNEALVNSQATTIRAALSEILDDHKKQKPPLIINADAETSHQAVIKVMDAARQIGLRRITFATRLLENE